MSELKVWIAYNKYRRWCEGLRIKPAAFKVWSQTTSQIGEHAINRQSMVGCFAGASRHPASN